MATNVKLPNVIEPNKLVIEDYEIIAFEKEEELDYYSLWHDRLRGKSFDDQTRQLTKSKQPTRSQQQQQQQEKQPQEKSHQQQARHEAPERVLVVQNRVQSDSLLEPQQQQQRTPKQSQSNQLYHVNTPQASQPSPGSGLQIHGQQIQPTSQDGKVVWMKYKLTKMYNKFRGRQIRRNFVLDNKKRQRIEEVVAKGQLNAWTAYTALQALRLPTSNVNQLSTIAITNNPKLITIPTTNVSTADNQNSAVKKKKAKKPDSASDQTSTTPSAPAPAMHYVYLDPNDVVTYSNRIFPQQVATYRKRAHLLPSSATSKKSSAASYDAYEIMEVLVNSDNTNVTITRNANKPAPAGCSIYSHSVNSNAKTQGIVSTQLHLQARSYLDTVAKFYSEEAIRLAEEEEKLRNEPPLEEQIRKYIKIENDN